MTAQEKEPYLITFPMAAIAYFFAQSLIYLTQLGASVIYCSLFFIYFQTDAAATPLDGLLLGIDFASFALNFFLVYVSFWYDEVDLPSFLYMIASGYVVNSVYTLRILQGIYLQAPLLVSVQMTQMRTRIAHGTFSELYFYGSVLLLLVHCAEIAGFTAFTRFYWNKSQDKMKTKRF